MINANNELLAALDGRAMIKCAAITYGDEFDEDRRTIKLKVEYSLGELNDFLKQMDFNYDNGFGGQNLFGIVWFENDTWLSRDEYDGSEWWRYNEVPEIPAELL